MKKFLSVLKGIRTVLKYAGLIIIIVDIIHYAVNKFEVYLISKSPDLKGDIEKMRVADGENKEGNIS